VAVSTLGVNGQEIPGSEDFKQPLRGGEGSEKLASKVQGWIVETNPLDYSSYYTDFQINRMPNQEDYLDRVWIKVINLDPNGTWVEECLSQCQSPCFEGVADALQRVILRKPSFERLGRVFRFVRYGACSAAFRGLEGPGLKLGKVCGLHAQLAASLALKARKALPERPYITALWDIIIPMARGTSLVTLVKDIAREDAFGDVPPSVQQLLKQQIKPADLDLVARWHRYDAILRLLELMEEEGFKRTTEIPGLHEILLGLEPSGKEGRAGSWPFLRKVG
jgi:hypothetical protein